MASKDFNWNFVEIKLTSDDKPKFKEWIKTAPGSALEVLDDITELGYKVSISWVDKQNAYVVSVSGNEHTPDNDKSTVTSWSGNLEECCYIAGYKILELARDKPWAECATESSAWG